MSISFKMTKEKLSRQMAKIEQENFEEKKSITLADKVNPNLKPLNQVHYEVNLEDFAKYKSIAKTFKEMSGSWVDTMQLLQSWLIGHKINHETFKAIVRFLDPGQFI